MAALVMVVSFCMPWWRADLTVQGFSVQHNAVQIYAHGLHHDLQQLRTYLIEDETPLYQTIAAWLYLSVSVLSVIASTWFKSNKSRWVPGIS
jgi:hypothetical protein